MTSMKEKKKQYFHTNLQDMDKLSGVVNDVFKTMGQFTMNFKEYLMETMEKMVIFMKTTTPGTHITMGKSLDEALDEESIDLDEDPILMSILYSCDTLLIWFR